MLKHDNELHVLSLKYNLGELKILRIKIKLHLLKTQEQYSLLVFYVSGELTSNYALKLRI